MKKNYFLQLTLLWGFIILLSLPEKSFSQQWGLYTLYATKDEYRAYLIDTTSSTYHYWDFSKASVYATYLIPGDTLVRTYKPSGNTSISGNVGARTGGIQKVTWDGTVAWDYTYYGSDYTAHHDICPMPNGNVLIIYLEEKSSSEATQAGSSSSSTFWAESIIEVKPTGSTTGEIVWEWHVWDHLCQDNNSSKDNYVNSIVDNPQLLNINYGGTLPDRWHMNGLDYNEDLDQIAISMHYMNSIFVIDHSTTTAEAAGHTAGNSGMGGDLIYRWGNPASWEASGNTVFNIVHDAHWISNEHQDYPNYLCGYNNKGGTSENTACNIVEPPYDGYNYNMTAGQMTPSSSTYQYTADFSANNEGNSQQLPNGNILICNFQGSIYEVDSEGTELWSKTNARSTHAYRFTKCEVRGPLASADASAETVYSGSEITLSSDAISVTETSPSYTYSWESNSSDFTSSSQNPSDNPTSSTTYTVTITNTTLGCSDTASVFVNVLATDPPTADFSGTPTSIMEGESVTFTDASTYAASRAWTFGDGGTSTEQNPVHTYTATGSYSVTLTVTNPLDSDTETKTDYITVAENTNPPTTDFEADNTNVNIGTTVNFTDLSINNPEEWSWIFAGGTPSTSTDQNPSIVYNTSGTYEVSLTSTNTHGSNEKIKSAYITVFAPDVIMSDGTTTSCAGTFKDSGGNSDYGSSEDITHTFYPGTTGAFVRLTFSELDIETNGTSCYDELSIYDGVGITSLIGTYCGTDYTVIGTNGVATSTDATGALTVVFTSDYSTVGSGWEAEISCYSPTIPPTADFTSNVTNTCTGIIQFTDQSELATSWLWDFGDGNTSTEQNPQYTYIADDTYTVSLYVENAYGNDTYSITDMITVDMPDSPTTTGAEACGAATLTLSAEGSGVLSWYDAQTGGNFITTGSEYTNTFTNTSTLYVQSGTTPESYSGGNTYIDSNGNNHTALNDRWLIFSAYEDFTLVSVQVNSNTEGDRIVELRNSSDEIIESYTANLSIGINTITLNFDIPVGTDYQLRCGTTTPNLWRNNAGTSWPYDIGDVVSITGTNASTTDRYYFFYNWEITTGDECISARTPVTATIYDIPVVDLGSDIVQCDGSVTLDAGAEMSTYTWNGSVGSQTFTTSTSGTYTVVVENAGGCTATDSIQVTIDTMPTVDAPEDVTACETYTLPTLINGAYFASTGGVNPIAEETAIISTQTIYVYASNGVCEAENSFIVTINDMPIVDSPADVEACDSYTLPELLVGEYFETSGGNDPLSVGTLITSDQTVYIYASNGTCEAENSFNITIHPGFTAAATATDETGVGTNDGSVTVVMTGGTPDFDGIWSNGVPTTTTGTSMTQIELTGGYYAVTITDNNGCTAEAATSVNTDGSVPVADFETDVVSGCDSLTVSFTDLSNNTPISWAWTFGDGQTSTNQNPEHTYSNAGIYTVMLTTTNVTGSSDVTMTDYIVVGETPVLTMSMTQETVAGNDGTATVIATDGTTPYVYEWSNGEDAASIYNIVAENYCVTVTEDNGCSISDCIEVTQEVISYEPVANFSADFTEGCGTLTVNFTDLSTNIPTSWAWTFGDGQTSTNQNPEHTYGTAGVYDVTLHIENADGNDDMTVVNYINVYENPTITVDVTNASGATVADGSATVNVIGGSAPYVIAWSTSENGTSISDLLPGNYSVIVQDNHSCVATSPFTIDWNTFTEINETVYSIYPNPTSGIINILSSQPVNIILTNSIGAILEIQENTDFLDISKYQNGIYYISVVSKDGSISNNKIILLK